MNRIENLFKKLKKNGETALIPFITTGDPDLATTEKLIIEMKKKGADLIELGLPFSDPLADGPTIQASSQRALLNNINARDLFSVIKKVRKKTDIPLVLMGYYNSMLQYGLKKFAKDAADSGLDGTIIPDLPLEEAKDWIKEARANNLCNILLVAPTTPAKRIKKIVSASQGFIYYVSVTGITGARKELPMDLREGLIKVKEVSKKPVCVGFGISRPKQVSMLSKVSDGIIVGSAIIRIMEQHLVDKDGGYKSGPHLVEKVGEFIEGLKKATKKS